MTKREYAYHLLKRRGKRIWRKHDGKPRCISLEMSEELRKRIEAMHSEQDDLWNYALSQMGVPAELQRP